MHHIRIFAALAALMFLLVVPCALSCAEDPLYPVLSHAQDQYMQTLSVMSQQDSVFEGVQYNNGWLTARGCHPLAMANGVIAAFEITDRETAVGVVLEATKLLAPHGKSKTKAVHPDFLPGVIDPAVRAAEADTYPYLAKTVGTYPGKVTYVHEVLSADEVLDIVRTQSAPAIVGSRMYVVDTWEDVVRIAYALHDMGMENAAIVLARAEVGKDTHGSPLRSGKHGHYLTLYLHVGTFMESGAVYVLDSLPRALEDEPSGGLLRSRYHFPEDRANGPFNSTFAAARISPTIIKLFLKEDKLAELILLDGEARIAQHTALLKPLLLFGSCSMLVSLKDN